MVKNWSSITSGALFSLAFLLAGFAVWERLANMMGLTLIFVGGFTAARLLELATVALLFVIALQLRQISIAVKGTDTGD